MTNLQKLTEIKDALNAKYFEREKEVEAILIALISRQHMLMIGPPGTGKSALAADISKIVSGMKHFQWLLTRFSTPEELYGPLSLKDLEQGIYKRNTTDKLPEAHISFLDEIFKANSAILNSLLTAINERIFYNNGQPVQIPLMSVIGSSNEYPEENEGLEALFDRFLLRFEVDYVADDNNFISMLQGGNQQPLPNMTLEELQELQFISEMVTIPQEVFEKLAEIRMHLKSEGINPSDRRFKQALSVLRAKALVEQRQNVIINDIVFLENALWETPDQKDLTQKVVRSMAQDTVISQLEQRQRELGEIKQSMQNDKSTDNTLESTKKLRVIISELNDLAKKNPQHADLIELTRKEVQTESEKLTEAILNPIG